MFNRQVDAVVVGAGPAGLSAARTLARLGFRTVVVERSSGPGEDGRVCDALVVSGLGLLAAESTASGFHFPQIDLHIPESLVLARTAVQQCVAPGGDAFDYFASHGDEPGALIDRSGLLRLLARQAEAAGARFAWNTYALGLLYDDDDRLCGVHTSAGDIEAPLVLSAEGSARHLCEQADLYPLLVRDGRHALIVSQELEAPAVGPAQLGRIVTLGRRYTSAQTGFGTLLMSSPGRATMIFTLFVDRIDCSVASTAWRYLAEYAHDPRIAGLLDGARLLQRSSYLMPIGAGPESVVRDGFMGIGDAVTPSGYLGILPSIFMGRQAALVAAEALEEGDPSAARLQPFDSFYRSIILPGLETELRAMSALLSLDDAEIDRLCAALNSLRLPLPFWLSGAQVSDATVAWLGRQVALPTHDIQLVSRVFAGADIEDLPATMPFFSSPLSYAAA